jgi:hypothetical protein
LTPVTVQEQVQDLYLYPDPICNPRMIIPQMRKSMAGFRKLSLWRKSGSMEV